MTHHQQPRADAEREAAVQAAFEAKFCAASPITYPDDPGSYGGYVASSTHHAWMGFQAGRAQALAEVAAMEPVAWLVEFGAVSLPKGHPSRITDFEAHHNEADALADAQACDYDTRVFALIARPQPDAPEGGEK